MPTSLLRPVTLHMTDAPLELVLVEISRQAGVGLSYGDDLVTARRTVSLRITHLPAADAFEAALRGTGCVLYVAPTGQATVLRDPNESLAGPRAHRQGAGTISGRVTDATTAQPIVGATLIVEATTSRAVTRNDGYYTISGVPAGAYTVSARVLGHSALTKRVVVSPDSTAQLDFTLAETVAALEQVVTTAIGDQRRLEVGNDITTIRADSVTRNAPITELTDVLSGRAPGVEVLSDGGILGQGVRLRIRGLSSLQLSNDPIIYVDGVRINASPGGNNSMAQTGGYVFPTPSRLNDIDPDDIESIDVLKGPSAATEYGTDAANGVIVIKTKHGQSGPPRWDFTAQDGITNVPKRIPLNWYGWGHTTGNAPTPVECPLTAVSGPTIGNGGCIVDSVTTFQPLDNSATTMFTTGVDQRYSARVSGAGPQLRYAMSGTYATATGPFRPDPPDLRAFEAAGQSIPSYVRTPNALTSTDLHGNFALPLGNRADASLSAGYVSNLQRSVAGITDNAIAAPGYRDSVYNGYTPFFGPAIEQLFSTASQGVSRFTGGVTGNWRPALWLKAHSTVGIDQTTQTSLVFRAPGPDPTFFTSTLPGAGYRAQELLNDRRYSVDVGVTASFQAAPTISSKTTIGAQYNKSGSAGTSTIAYGLAANNSLNGAAIATPGEVDNVSATLGSYAEETLGWRDRLFLTGGLRVDAGSGFGTQVHSAVYPKVSGSWLAWEHGAQSVRLRAAYGASGVQPIPGATLRLLSPATVALGANAIPGDTLVSLANPRLRPERQTEFEGGIDASDLAGRLDMTLTYYSKLSRGALVNVTLPASAGALTEEENIGSVRNYGLEGTMTGHVVETQPLTWDITVGGSLNHNRLVSLAPRVPSIDGYPLYGVQYRDVAGYPIYGYWAPIVHYVDANHDGIIEPNEVTESAQSAYVGSSTPTEEVTVSTGVGIFGDRLRLSAQVNHRGGYKLENQFLWVDDIAGVSAEDLNNRRLPLWRQARAIEAGLTFTPLPNGYFEDATYTRLREVAIRYVLPTGLARAMRARSASIMISGRNLALWTHYTGADPEVNNPGNGGPATPGDAVIDYGTVPQLRSWTLRLDMGY